jgi:hypothetical protein
MFGMLDYRAHKLYWIICLPFRLVSRAAFLVIIAIAIGIAKWTEFNPLGQIGIGYVSMEGIALLFYFLWLMLIAVPIEKAFFWLVDIIPSRGVDLQEAKSVVKLGPIVWLSKKMSSDIDSWTYEDTEYMASTMNWRARLLDGRKRLEDRVRALQDAYYETGKQPSDFRQDEIKKLIQPYEFRWYETFFMSQQGFNSMMGATIIAVAILYMNS